MNTRSLFPDTKWTIVLKAGGETEGARQALNELCEVYRDPLLVWARVRYGQEAEDLVQGCFASIIAKKSYAKATPERGKLRTFLLTALIRHARDEWRRRMADKRGGDLELIAIDEALDVADDPSDRPDAEYDRAWATRVLIRGIERLEERWKKAGKTLEFRVFQSLLGRPSHSRAEYAEGALRLGLTPQNFRKQLHDFRKANQREVRAEIGDTLAAADGSAPSEKAIEAEYRALLGALQRP